MGLFSWMFKKKPRELSPLEIAKGYKRDSQGVIRDKYDLKVPQPDKNGRISDGELYAYMSSVDEQRRKIGAVRTQHLPESFGPVRRRPYTYDAPVSTRPKISSPALGAPYERKKKNDDVHNGFADDVYTPIASAAISAIESSRDDSPSHSHSDHSSSHSPSYDSGGYDSGSSSSSSDSGGGEVAAAINTLLSAKLPRGRITSIHAGAKRWALGATFSGVT